ncbi:acetyltransferase [Kitasatospora sp. MMS16-BH015]|uniref:arylamine N-acetyltransferase family protein n=1 Tax=Kitasatospora sp. MMS16-BH015 TaxID=2018025 RepID=UPI000CA3ABE8|nr:arylamine N-acetyltransferase [Kitasatospora sp. MMS16-BH015]AUG75766.1 acetyltransferase [Kitasatospora sp. MMS16-BH015]
MQDTRVDEYLARIGAARPARPDLDGLRRLQEAHLLAVPFENLSIHLGEPVSLDEDALLAKIVDRRRGGFCYELNGAFAALLTALGYRVDLLSARVFGAAGLTTPFDHLALRVQLDGPWLVDVGFGRFARQPLRLDTREPQPDPAGTFTVEATPEGDLDVTMAGEAQYRLDQRPYALTDFAPTCWYQTTSPASHFTVSSTCSRPTPAGGRVTLAGTRLITTTPDGTRTEADLTPAEALTAYRDHFGITLDRLPGLPGRP